MLRRNPYQIPPTSPGMKIGLFGGSFNPPHMGHVHVSETALQALELDQIWWLVTPGNPLKDHKQLLPLNERIARCRELAQNPSIRICAIEDKYNVRYTADTLAILNSRRANVNFVWVMGADNLAGFHHWERWREIANHTPIAVIDRPGSTKSLRSSRVAQTLAQFRLDERDASLLATSKPPAWTFIHAKRSYLSSTKIRDRLKNAGLPSPQGMVYSANLKPASNDALMKPEDKLAKTIKKRSTKKASAKSSGADMRAVEDVLKVVIESLENSKAEDIQPINITDKSSIGDYMVIASGRSHRHVGAVASLLLRDLKLVGVKTPKIEGQQNGDWVLIDIGDIIIHLFRPEVREFYNLEKMWMLPRIPDQ